MADCEKLFDASCKRFSDNRKIISLEERKGRKYIAQNTNLTTVCVFNVDGCLIKEGIKCDFLLIQSEVKKSYFIELKGADLLHAIRQINSSIDILKNKLSGYNLYARIVLSKASVPDLKSSEIIKLEQKLKKTGGDLIKQVNQLQEEI